VSDCRRFRNGVLSLDDIGKFGLRCFDLTDEAVSAPRQSFDVLGIVGGIAEGFTQLVNGSVQAMTEIDESILRPEQVAQLVARDQFSGTRDEHLQHPERLTGEFETDSVLPEFLRPEICLERAEAETMIQVISGHNRHLRLAACSAGAWSVPTITFLTP
jgi:hypothetical protein